MTGFMDCHLKRGMDPPLEKAVENIVIIEEHNREKRSKKSKDRPATENADVIPYSGSNIADQLDSYNVCKRKRTGNGGKTKDLSLPPCPD